jgi:hypothetical protein
MLSGNRLRYIKWMSINTWANSTSYVISANSMLNSIMITPSYTTVIATTYIGKDVIGQIGGFVYALKTGKSADKEPLKYVTKGELLQQSALFLENISCLISNKDVVLPFLGLSNIIKNIAFISCGAVNAKNLQKLSPENIGEFYSRVASINTLSSTIGMVSGLALLHFVPSYTLRSIVILPILNIISVYSVRQANKIDK